MGLLRNFLKIQKTRLKTCLLLMCVLLAYSGALSANVFDFKKRIKKEKLNYKFEQCIDGVTQYREALTYDEICKYGSGCPAEPHAKKKEMFCQSENLSECFEQKQWKTAHELIGVEQQIEINEVTQGFNSKRGAKKGKTCAHYKNKPK